jgi:hypothetical protein
MLFILLGCPTNIVTCSGIMDTWSKATREPFIHCHFAGTESALQWQGYMDGAVESGERCANEIVHDLFKESGTQCDFNKTYYGQTLLAKSIKNAPDMEKIIKRALLAVCIFIFLLAFYYCFA